MNKKRHNEPSFYKGITQYVIDVTMRIDQLLYSQFVAFNKIGKLPFFFLLDTTRINNRALIGLVKQNVCVLHEWVKNKFFDLQHRLGLESKNKLDFCYCN